MAGVRGKSGGHNALSLADHLHRGTFRADRHLPKSASSPQPLSPEDRRRTLHGLTPAERRIVERLLEAYEDWDAGSLLLLRHFARSTARLEELTDDGERRRELRVNVMLLRALNLEHTSK